METENKAKELMDSFNVTELIKKYPNIFDINKLTALRCIDEILEATKKYVAIRQKTYKTKTGYENVVNTVYDKYWLSVKDKILND